MSDFLTRLQGGLSKAYTPIVGGLENATRGVFGDKARFFPESWTDKVTPPDTPATGGRPAPPGGPQVSLSDLLGSKPPISDAGGIAAGMDLGGKRPVYDDPSKMQSTYTKPAEESRALTSAFDLKRLGQDLADGKVRNAPGLADQIVGSPKPKTTKETSGFNFTPGPSGMSESLGSVMPSLDEERAATTSADSKAGGEGVETSDVETGSQGEEKQPRDWGNIFARIAVGAGDLGNAFGNPRAAIQGGGYQMAKDRLQQQQVAQLKQRHGMWDRAYQDAQALPAEVLQDPKFASLAQAKAALEKDMLDGKIDNEKNVSTFLTEKDRFSRDLEQLGIDIKAKQQLDVEAKLSEGRAANEAEQTRKAQEIASNPTAYTEAEVERARLILASREQIYEEDGQQLKMTPTQYAQWKRQNELADEDRRIRELGITESSRARVEAAQLAAQARRDSLNDRKGDYRARFVQDSYEKAISRRIPPREAMEDMDEATRNKVISDAAMGAIDELAPRLEAAAQQAGIPVQVDAAGGTIKVGDQTFDNKRDALYYMMTMLGGGGL